MWLNRGGFPSERKMENWGQTALCNLEGKEKQGCMHCFPCSRVRVPIYVQNATQAQVANV